jgi:hypothetical protein
MNVPVLTHQRQRRWRRAAIAVFNMYLTLSAVVLLIAAPFQLMGGSMEAFHYGSPGVVITGDFAYPYRTPKGRAVDIPVTVPERFSGPARVVVDQDRFLPEDQTDLGPLAADGPGYVSLPEGVYLYHNSRSRGDLHVLEDESRLVLQIPWRVGWKGRLLATLPPTLTILALGVTMLMFASFLRTIFEGQPFHPKNPGRLLWLAGSLLVAFLADSWLHTWAGQAILDVLAEHGHRIPLRMQGPGIGPVPILVVVALAALAWAFRVGTRLAADTDGLV